MGRPGPLEIGIVLVIILIVFGVGKLPQVGAALGKSINAFKKGSSGEEIEETAVKTKKKTKKKTKTTKKPTANVSEGETKPKAEETPEEAA